MKPVVGVINYGTAGNTFSIHKALEAVGGKAKPLNHESDFKDIDKIILPGVGSFADGMSALNAQGLRDKICSEVVKGTPTLGICLGMQILSNIGFESGETEGLSLIDAEVRKVSCKAVVPHMGFNGVKIIRDNPLFAGIGEDDRFYFMHSYEVCNYTDVLSLSTYGAHTFVSAVGKANLFGVQFHPEKSRDSGLKVVSNFVNKV